MRPLSEIEAAISSLVGWHSSRTEHSRVNRSRPLRYTDRMLGLARLDATGPV
jgi:hypothetical protein